MSAFFGACVVVVSDFIAAICVFGAFVGFCDLNKLLHCQRVFFVYRVPANFIRFDSKTQACHAICNRRGGIDIQPMVTWLLSGARQTSGLLVSNSGAFSWLKLACFVVSRGLEHCPDVSKF